MIYDIPCRKLRLNHRTSFPQRVIYLDVETRFQDEEVAQKHYIRLAWLCYWERQGDKQKHTEIWKEFESAHALWAWVDDRARDEKPLWVFGHNIYYDLQSSDFFHLMPKKKWTLEFLHDKGMSYILLIRRHKHSIKFVSTTNYFLDSVEGLGKMVGLAKLPIDFKSCTRQELSDYCKRDVEIIKLCMENYFELIRKHDLAQFSLTKASQAMHAFRHRFMDRPVYIHGFEPAQKLEKSAYIGGRTEAFFIGKARDGPFLTLDVNSMYPFIMKNCPVPVKLVNYHEDPTQLQITDWIKKYGLVTEACLETDEPIYAIKLRDRVVFPIGRIVAFLNTGGVIEALKRGHLKRVRKAALYEIDIIFDKFVDSLYHLRTYYRKEDNKVFEQFLKYLLNALYGKFAQYVPKTAEMEEHEGREYYREEIWTDDGEKPLLQYKLFNKVVQEEKRVIGKNSFVAISAHITEWARLLLWEIIEPLWPDKVLYCDTDSVKIRERDLPSLKRKIDEYSLGCLKIEKQSDDLIIGGAKNYRQDGKRTIKGIPKTAIETVPDTFEFISFPRQSTHMRKEISRYFEARKTTRKLSGKYEKGIVIDDGRVRPFSLVMW